MRSVAVWALALDLWRGEPPARLHPVVWLGRIASILIGRSTAKSPAAQIAAGAGVVGTIVAVAALPAFLAERRLKRHPKLASALLLALLLKPTFAVRALFSAFDDVASALQSGNLTVARTHAQQLVSRDTSDLDPALVAAAAIESLFENIGDSVVAPLLAWHTLGLAGAAAYRAVNTLDAMIGYRGQYEYLGKVAARLDDLLNLIPARLTALLIIGASPLAGCAPVAAASALWRDHASTASPNAGWPMSAAAGALGLRLEKPGHYVLNENGRLPTIGDLARARRLAVATLIVGVAALECVARVARPLVALKGERRDEALKRNDEIFADRPYPGVDECSLFNRVFRVLALKGQGGDEDAPSACALAPSSLRSPFKATMAGDDAD